MIYLFFFVLLLIMIHFYQKKLVFYIYYPLNKEIQTFRLEDRQPNRHIQYSNKK